MIEKVSFNKLIVKMFINSIANFLTSVVSNHRPSAFSVFSRASSSVRFMPPQFKSQIFASWTQRQRHDRPSRRGRGQERYVADSNGDQVQDVQVLSRVRSTFPGNCQVLLRVRRQKTRVVNIVLRAWPLITLHFDI